jgi:hypothetical protein
MVPDDTVTDTNRIDRRDAMKAALGGAVAAAALSAPSISGFSLAPNFAAAASQCPAGSSVTGTPSTQSRSSETCVATKCWGTFSGICSCGNYTFSLITVNAAAAQYTDPTISVTVGNQVKNNTSNNLTITLAGFNAGQPFDRCTVTIGGSCSGGSSATPTVDNGLVFGANNFTANNTYNGRIKCPGSVIQSPNGTVTIAASCRCS